LTVSNSFLALLILPAFRGTLQEGLLNTEFTLAEARILYELATREAPKAKEIAEALGMDAGYLSRILGNLSGRRC
jgi:DNA-binding MarR family transcriptional regulator